MRTPKFMKWVFDGDHLGLWTCPKYGWFEDLEDFSDPRFPPGVYNDYYYCPRCGELLTAYEDRDGVE